MDQQIIDNLKKLAVQIRDEKGFSANTATRIGNMFLQIISALETIPGGMQYLVRDLGVFDPKATYMHGYSEEEGAFVTHQVWFGGCCWQCNVPKSTPGLYPRYNNSEWTCVLGSGNVTLAIENAKSPFVLVGAHYETTLTAVIKNAEMQLTEDEIGRRNIRWTRLTDNPQDDAAWNALHTAGAVGLTLEIDSDKDMPQEWWRQGKIGYRCVIQLPSGLEVSAEYNF